MPYSSLDINLLHVLAAGAAYFLLGAPWFSQRLFGKTWERSIGFERPAGWKETKIYYIGPFIGSMIAAAALAILQSQLRIFSLGNAAALGFLCGAGFSASITLTNAITPKTPKPLLFTAVVGTYHVLGMSLASVIIYALGN